MSRAIGNTDPVRETRPWYNLIGQCLYGLLKILFQLPVGPTNRGFLVFRFLFKMVRLFLVFRFLFKMVRLFKGLTLNLTPKQYKERSELHN